MDTCLLRMFCAVAKNGSLGATARQLHLTPSAISHGLKSLETQLSCRLFDRAGKRMLLNQAGEQLLAQVEAPLSALDAAEESIKGLAKWGQTRLRVGAADKDVREAASRALARIAPETAAKVGVNRPTDTPADASASRVVINFKSAPVSVVLEFYKSLSGAELVMGFNPDSTPGWVTLQPVKPLTHVEAAGAIESVLLEQANIEINHISDKRVSVTWKGPQQ